MYLASDFYQTKNGAFNVLQITYKLTIKWVGDVKEATDYRSDYQSEQYDMTFYSYSLQSDTHRY